MWPALPVPRLEVRLHRPMHRSAVGARGKRVCAEDQAALLSAGRAWRHFVDLYGASRAPTAAAGMGIRNGQAGAAFHIEALPREQLVAGDGRRYRFESRLLAAP